MKTDESYINMSGLLAPASVRYLHLLLVLIVLAFFSPVTGFDFVIYDDPEYVSENTMVLRGITLEGLRWAFLAPHEANWIPLTWLSYMLEVQLFGLNPSVHHFVNALLHAFSSALLFLYLKRATGFEWRSLVVALLFAFHPLHVESVAWIAERKDVLSGLFFMLAINAYGRYAQRPAIPWYLAVLACFAFGLMAKPMLVTLPLVLLLLDWWPHDRFGDIPFKRLLLEKIPFALLALAVGIVTWFSQRSGNAVEEMYSFPIRAARASAAYCIYLSQTFWPADLAVIYPFSPYPPTLLQIFLSATMLCAITVIALVLRQTRPYLLTGWFWYLIILLPVSGIVQIGYHSHADRYTYLPLTGVFIMTVWHVSESTISFSCRKYLLPMLSTILLVLLTVVASLQLRHWKNSIALFSRAVAVTENNWVASNNLGLSLYQTGRIDEAAGQFREAVRIRPSDVKAHLNLALISRLRGEYGAAEELLNKALESSGGNASARLELGRLYLETGRRELAQKQYMILLGSGQAEAELLRADMVSRDQGAGR